MCINAEGLAHIFDIPRLVPGMTLNLPQISAEEYLTQTRHASDTATIQAFRNMMAVDNEIPSNNVAKSAIYDLQQPNLTLKVPVNVNRILIADIGKFHPFTFNQRSSWAYGYDRRRRFQRTRTSPNRPYFTRFPTFATRE